MAKLRTGTFLRLIGMDLVKRKAAFEGQMLPIALPTGLDAAITALGAAQYGPTKPSIMPYIGYELIVGVDLAADVSASSGDVTKVWQTDFTGAGRLPHKIQIPGRDTGDSVLTLPGSENKINTAAAPWTAWAAALHDPNLLIPYNGTTFEPWIGGVSVARPRVQPKEVIRQVPSPIVVANTRLKLYGLDVRGKKGFSEFNILQVPIVTAVATAIAALGAATYGAVVGTTPKPSVLTYVGYEVIVSKDAGFTGSGFGDTRAKWRVVSEGIAGADIRFSIPGRNDAQANLFSPGSYTLANFSGGAWPAWTAAMTDAHLTAPLDVNNVQATLTGALAGNRGASPPRENVS